jgi:hypothetical protein
VSVKLNYLSTILVYEESEIGTKMGVNMNVKGKEVKEPPYVKIEFRTKVRDGEKYEIACVMERFGGSPYTDVIKGRCDKWMVINLLDQLNWLSFSFRATKTDNAIYISGSDAKVVMRYVAILVGFMHCTKDPYKYVDLMYEVAGLSEYESIFWFSRLVDLYERKGRQSICRAAKAFRILYKVD